MDSTTQSEMKTTNEPWAPPQSCRPACYVCGGRLIDIRAKLQCSQCHRIVETCCERVREVRSAWDDPPLTDVRGSDGGRPRLFPSRARQ